VGKLSLGRGGNYAQKIGEKTSTVEMENSALWQGGLQFVFKRTGTSGEKKKERRGRNE